MNRRLRIDYWFARITLNVISVGVFAALARLFDFQFSMKLYWCAFAVYVVLSIGDDGLDYVWPLPQQAPPTNSP